VISTNSNNEKKDWAGSLWGPLAFFSMGLLCFVAPEEMLNDPGWKFVPNKTNFGRACGAIFLGGAIVFHAHFFWKPKGYRKFSTCGLLLGAVLILTGWAYVLWITGLPWL